MNDTYAAIRIPDFRLFLTARLCITLAIQIQSVVVGWQIYQITNDPLSLGLIGLAEAIPAITVALYAGHLADIVDRKQIIQWCVLLLCVCSAALTFFTMSSGAWVLEKGVFPIYTIIFITGFARGFLSPAAFSFMPQLVCRELYQNAITWNSTIWQSAAVGGPMIGGLIYGFSGITTAYSIDLFFLCIGLIGITSIKNRPVPTGSHTLDIFDRIKEGVHFVFSNQIILAALVLDLFAVLFGGAVALLPIFAADILHIGSQGLGYLRSAPALGALLMALLITKFPIQRNVGKILLWCVAGFGVCMIGFAWSTVFWVSFGLLVLSGLFDSVSVIVRSTLIHTLTPENMKGRVSAVNTIFIGSSNEIGSFESGVAARAMGVVNSVVFGGVMTLLVVGVTSWKANALRVLDQMK